MIIFQKRISLADADKKLILNEFHKNAQVSKNLGRIEPYAFTSHDEDGSLLAAVSGNTAYGSLFVDLLWVRENLRGNGYGSELMREAEKHARAKNCSFICLTTMDWEAAAFYEKLGFKLEFKRGGYASNSFKNFYIKHIS